MTAQPALSRIDTYDFAFRTTPDSHPRRQPTLCSIFTDHLIPCLGFKILVKRRSIPMLHFLRLVLGVGSLETIIDSKCSILFRSVPAIKRRRHPNQRRFQKIYGKVFSSRTSGKNSGKRYEDEESARSYWPSCRTRGIPGLDSAMFPHLVPPVNSLFTGVITKLTGIS